MRYGAVVICLVLCGCASPGPMVTAPPAPLPEDHGWSTPRVPAPEIPPPAPVERPATAAEKVIAYRDGERIDVPVAVGSPVTIQLSADETAISIVGGDRGVVPAEDPEPPWEIKLGEPGSKYAYIHVTATRPGLKQGVHIPTTKRLYLVDLRSVKASPVRLVRFTYDDIPTRPPEAKTRRLPDATTPALYHTGFEVHTPDPRPVWTPRQVVSAPAATGFKTYVIFPPQIAGVSLPLIRLLGPTGYEVVNADMVGNVMVLDHLIERVAELRMGTGKTAETVRIVRQTPRPITCPGDPECPVWPVR